MFFDCPRTASARRRIALVSSFSGSTTTMGNVLRASPEPLHNLPTAH
jgi:hypothetical protein